MTEKDVLNQDDIDSLLTQMQQESRTSKPAAKEAAGDPNLDPAAWGLTEDDLKSEGEKKAPPKETPPPAAPVTQKMPMQTFEKAPAPAGTQRDLDFVLDIPLVLTVEVGRSRLTIGELLTLGPGSIVELQKLAGEPLEVFINDKLVARGEAVIINEKFGIRLTDVISKAERIESLK